MEPVETPNKVLKEFNSLFYPKSVAIVGASKNKIGGSKFWLALQYTGFEEIGGRTYLINPKLSELFGRKVYSSLLDKEIPKPIDLVIIAVPAKLVPEIVMQCDKIVKFGVIFTSGFGEADNISLENDLKNAINSVSTRFIGPNGLGIINPYSRLAIYPDWGVFKGNVSYISQSGGTLARLYLNLGPLGIGFHNCVSIGNSYDISINEVLDYFYHDKLTKIIALYMESNPNARKFMQLAQKITPIKPIVLWKGGQTKRGISATQSHTGGLAGRYDVWKAMCKQSGILLADHFELFIDLIQVASTRPVTPKNLNVAILVAGGGIGVEFADKFESAGFSIVDLQNETKDKLSEIFPPINTNLKNPLDLGELSYDPRLFSQAMEIVLKDEGVGSVVFVREAERFDIISKMIGIEDAQQMTIDSLSKIIRNSPKPVICNSSMNIDNEKGYHQRHEFQVKMIEAGMPVVNYLGNIPKILKQFYYFGKFLKNRKK
ncbi:CoA-binding protein [Promethearchaeum syntrophicum]|uniref:CoA-binding protein n=1 Tax=Promethearchaeum syntrophicum TaxID=2594042 RepID=A0A5B9DDH2_9ARCH|nr:CoA-binding protein [Candidatus Prometheoarchaeum syntrophicum]QEE17081.1 succinyl-CoA synthetase subunit alpha [Candidatus Prometheoarchaeum syntrophicum]